MDCAAIIMAAGRGSRMTGYTGNKTVLPLEPASEKSVFEGEKPLICHILKALPAGSKAVIVNHCQEMVRTATVDLGVEYIEQPELNGTGGAVLAARGFLDTLDAEMLLITMGDVPLVKAETYRRLVTHLEQHPLVVLGFEPVDKKKYGLLETSGDCVEKITEWKYWHQYPEERQAQLTICNSGIYAARTTGFKRYLDVLASRPQQVEKQVDGCKIMFNEFFFTDVVEFMVADGLSVGYLKTDDPDETMGVDDVAALKKVQQLFGTKKETAL